MSESAQMLARHSLVAARLALAAAFGLTSFSAAPTLAAQPAAPTLSFSAPAQAAVGEVIPLTLTLNQATDIAGYETAVLFDPAVAEYAGAQQRANGLAQLGRGVSPLTAVDLTAGATVGLFSCPVADCVSGVGPAAQTLGAPADLPLATIYLVANQPGALEVRLDALKFVDAAGSPVAVAVPQPAVTIQVGEAGAGPTYAAPAGMWALTPAAADGQGLAASGPFDLTGDNLVDHADAMEVALEWTLLRQSQQACGALPDPTRDVNHDGCVDVADLQLLAANFGAVTVEPPAEPPILPPMSFLPLIFGAEAATQVQATESTYTVNSTGDQADKNIGNNVCLTAGGVCTLRAAIQEANAHAGADTINFNIPGSGVQTIAPASQLPSLSGGGTTINGYSQPGASPNTAQLADNAVIRIQIQGAGGNGFDGLRLTSANNVVKGLALYQLQRPFWVFGSGASNNVIVGNFIGTNAAGTYGTGTLFNSAHGVHVEQGAHNNIIGRPNLADRNVISGNGRHGLGLWHEGTDNNVVQNNIIGLNPAGTNRLPNRKHGLDINFGAAFNTYGGTAQYEHNVASGNDDSGQELSHTSGTTGNQVIGNYYGTDLTGNAAPSWSHNLGRGLMIEDGATGNTVANNVIGGNNMGGLEVYDDHTGANVIRNNRIGVGLNGAAIPNTFGIWIKGHNLMIGPGNIIAFNTNAGIKIEGDGADFNTITRNSIYNNGSWGIELFPRGVNPPNVPTTGPNQGVDAPVLTAATPSQVSGTACAGCTVEVFIADSGASDWGEGKTFIGSATANASGNFSVAVSGVNVGQTVTATTTDGAGNTSEFSKNRTVTSS